MVVLMNVYFGGRTSIERSQIFRKTITSFNHPIPNEFVPRSKVDICISLVC